MGAVYGIVGDSVPLAKLLLYPFAVLLTFTTDSLARRFAAGAENLLIALGVLSPWILPSFNFMLDVPALGLGLAAIVLFMRGCDRTSMPIVVAAGLLAGVATQWIRARNSGIGIGATGQVPISSCFMGLQSVIRGRPVRTMVIDKAAP